MSSFAYRQGALCVESVTLSQIADEVGTPFYCYSTQQLQKNYQDFAAPFKDLPMTIHFANKANPNQAVMRTLAACGAGADITSGGELERALEAGVPAAKIVYSGVGKRREEIAAALAAHIRQINVESIPELRVISAVARDMNLTAPVTLRVNPDVDAKTLKKTSTGHKETKFGIEVAHLPEALALVKSLPALAFKGLTVHLGSYMGNYDAYRQGYDKLAKLVRQLRAEGVTIERLDLGGGVGIPYEGEKFAPFADYAAIVQELIAPLGCELSFEPGRRLVGDAGILVSRVLYVKQGTVKKFLIIDAAMNDLVRPAMYGARHGIVPVKEGEAIDVPLEKVDVVGPICETADLFGSDYHLPPQQSGDLVAILQAGAYASAMAGTYNGRPLIPEILVAGANYAVVRRRISVAEQISWENTPFWLEKTKAA